MTAHPPPHPDPVPDTDQLRAAANRRIVVFVVVFTLLLAGALWLVLREEKRRGTLLIQPEIPAVPAPVLPAPQHPLNGTTTLLNQYTKQP